MKIDIRIIREWAKSNIEHKNNMIEVASKYLEDTHYQYELGQLDAYKNLLNLLTELEKE